MSTQAAPALSPALTQRLTALLAQPTAPFRELHVIDHVSGYFRHHRVPHFADPHGNLVVGAESRRDYAALLRSRGDQPVRVFVAHMDHPGFHGVRWLAPDRLAVRWYGGSPVKHLAGARVRLAGPEGVIGSGAFARVRINAHGRSIDSAEIRLTPAQAEAVRGRSARSLFGGFEFRAPVWQQRGRIYCPAADDLVGVFAIMETARRLWRSPRPRPPFLAVLTRAEEIGFVGAVAHLELGWLQRAARPLLIVSLEASRTLPGAVVGQGPVVRLGDRRTVFQPDGLKVLSDTAQRVLPGRHQRRVMDGGSCEATAATAWGLPAIGISVPLGNYHNEGFEGGPDCPAPRAPAPEFVSMSDVAGLLRLCRGLMRGDLAWRDPWARQRALLRHNRKRYQRLL
jgi:putative aminopeptidase FrvX